MQQNVACRWASSLCCLATCGHTHTPEHLRYQVTDKVPSKGHPDWNRVVAVIVLVSDMQFNLNMHTGQEGRTNSEAGRAAAACRTVISEP